MALSECCSSVGSLSQPGSRQGRTILIAYVDESHSGPNRAGGEFVYVMAAVALAAADADDAHRSTSELLQGSRKRHWYHSTAAMRQQSIEAVSDLALFSITAELTHPDAMTQERRRRLCLEQLLVALEELEVPTAVLESRGKADDRRDRHMLDALRSQRRVRRIRVDHAPAPSDPRLWLADAVCGSAHSSIRGDSRYMDELDRLGTVIRLQVTAR